MGFIYFQQVRGAIFVGLAFYTYPEFSPLTPLGFFFLVLFFQSLCQVLLCAPFFGGETWFSPTLQSNGGWCGQRRSGGSFEDPKENRASKRGGADTTES